MATSEPAAVGIAHPTVVPTNFDADVADSTPPDADRVSCEASHAGTGRDARE